MFCLQLRAEQLTRFSNIIGRDKGMLQVFQQIRDVADYDYPVHISGDTGTGKELVAAAIHNESRRAGAPFVPINCGALPEGLLESELFGHVKGAFSGAIRDKKGRFELAEGGTVFLDEVAELSKPMQVKLLRFLQAGTFEKVGGEETVAVDVRIISATNKDLKSEVKKKNFRDDLYYRLNVIPIHIPPLRERKNDIPLLIDHFLEEAAQRYGNHPLRASKTALALMLDYLWPGNVRELQNAIQYAIVKSNGKVIQPEDLPMEFRKATPLQKARGPAVKLNAEQVRAALLKTGGNKARAARRLGVGRATLYRFLDRHPDLIID
jgi:transcriptional regulator with PAS, ATPase and Fis domain